MVTLLLPLSRSFYLRDKAWLQWAGTQSVPGQRSHAERGNECDREGSTDFRVLFNLFTLMLYNIS